MTVGEATIARGAPSGGVVAGTGSGSPAVAGSGGEGIGGECAGGLDAAGTVARGGTGADAGVPETFR